MTGRVVIAGGGQAGVQLCMALRREKYPGAISLMCAEPDYPYHRPPLSKSFVTAASNEDKLPMRPESFYAKNAIDVHLAAPVTAIDPVAKSVEFAGGEIRYETLVLATGATPRLLPWQYDAPSGVHVLRDLADARSIREALPGCRSLVVVGGGFIGLELAAAAVGSGCHVSVFETAERVMGRAVAPMVSRWFEQTHRHAGIDIRLDSAIAGLQHSDGKVTAVTTSDGESVGADLVVVGVGVEPNSALAEDAGIDCDNGILVNPFCQTSIADIYACGDCAAHSNPFAGGRTIRLESIQNATDQARTIAASLAGRAEPYRAVPWFWSDQGQHKLQMTGLNFDADTWLQRGDTHTGQFSVFHYRQQQLLAVDSVNDSRVHMIARKLIGAGISPNHQQITDPEFDLKTLV